MYSHCCLNHNDFFSAPQVVLILTSNKQERNQGPYTPLLAASQGLSERDVSIYVIGIGDKVKIPELMDLASDYRNVFVTSDFTTLFSRGIMVTDIIRNDTKAVSKGKLLLPLA